MATAISRDVLNKETNARFWAQTKHKVGKPLDPKNPLDKAKIPVWNDIFRKVQAEASAGRLVTTFDKAEVAQALADAQLANTVAETHVNAAVTADPVTAQQHIVAATTAKQVAAIKTEEAAASQPPTVSPQLVADAKREAAKTPPPPHAPAADQIAHAQLQKNVMLLPEEDPWDSRYVKPREPAGPPKPPPVSPSRSPRERPSQKVINDETNARFWVRTKYKPHEKLNLAIPEDRAKAEIWKQILREVESEANAGRLTLTNPELIPPRSSRERPSQKVINDETNARFWVRTKYKPHEKLNLTIPADREKAEIWKQILREVESEANAGRLTLTNPELIPPRSTTPRPPAPPPPAPRPAPRPQQPRPPAPRPPPVQPQPPRQPQPPQPRPPQPGPMGPGPMGPGPMGPGPIGPGPMGPGPMSPRPGPMGPGPMSPRPGPMGPGPMGPRPGPMGPGPMGPGPGPMGPGPMGSGPIRPPIDPGPAQQPGGPGSAPAPSPETPIDTGSPAGQPSGGPTGETSPSPDAKDEGPVTTDAPAEQPSSAGKWIALSLVGVLLVGTAGYAISRSRKTAASRGRSRASREEDDATIRSSMRDASFSFPASGRWRP